MRASIAAGFACVACMRGGAGKAYMKQLHEVQTRDVSMHAQMHDGLTCIAVR